MSLNVALVGYGFVGATFHAPLIRATPGLVLHTVVSSRAEDVVAAEPGVVVRAELADALADPAIDLVVIATPNTLHAPMAHAALAAGKHVVVDKPFTVTLAEAEAVLAHGAQAGRLVSVFQNRRWDADFRTLQALVAAGSLGELAEVQAHFDRYRPTVRARWREGAEPGSGLWFDLGPHLVDQAVVLLGRPEAVWADLRAQRAGAVSDDSFHVVLRYPRCRVVLHGGSLVPDHRLRFAVHGRKGSFVKDGLDAQEDALRAGMQPGTEGWGVDPLPGRLTRADGTTERVAGLPGDYGLYYAAVRDAIATGQPGPVSATDMRTVMRVLEAASLSAQERREIAL